MILIIAKTVQAAVSRIFFRNHRFAMLWLSLLLIGSKGIAQQNPVRQLIHPLSFQQVKLNDQFWSPKFNVWTTKTVYDVFDKLEGKYDPDRPDIIDEKNKTGRTRNAFLNFDIVAQGKTNTKTHDGPPWYDGLVY